MNNTKNSGINNSVYIDGNKSYTYSMYIMGTNENASIGAIGFLSYDIDGKRTDFSELPEFMEYTVLTQDLNNDDTEIHVKDAELLKKREIFSNRIMFWNYKDSTGHLYPEFIYTKNVFQYRTLYDTNGIDVENNKILLSEPWNHGTFEKDTKVSILSTNNSLENADILNPKSISINEWQLLKKTISGFHYKTGQWLDRSSFMNAAKSIRSYFLYLNGIKFSRIIFSETDKYEVPIEITISKPLRSNGEVADYIDFNTGKIVRKIGEDGNILDKEIIEEIDLPEIPTYDGNTIIETTDEVMPILEVRY